MDFNETKWLLQLIAFIKQGKNGFISSNLPIKVDFDMVVSESHPHPALCSGSSVNLV